MAELVITAAISIALNFAIRALTAPHRKSNQDFSRPGASNNIYIPEVFSTVKVPGILVWMLFPPDQYSSGGKGGGGGGQDTYVGSAAFILAQADPNFDDLSFGQFWFNSEVLYDHSTGWMDPRIQGCSIRCHNGSPSQGIDPLLASRQVDPIPYRYRAYVVIENIPLTHFGNQYFQLAVELKNNGGSQSLDKVIERICFKAGYAPEQIDASELASYVVPGYAITQQQSALEKLHPLQQAFFFELLNTGNQLKFTQIQRDGVAAIIPPEDLAAYEYGQQRPHDYQASRTIAEDLPSQVVVNFSDINNHYQPGGPARSVKHYLATKDHILSIDLSGLVLDLSGATRIANTALYLAWMRRETYKITLPVKYSYLEPTDVIQLSGNSYLSQIQLSRINQGANDLLECEGYKYKTYLMNQSYSTGVQGRIQPAVTQGVSIFISSRLISVGLVTKLSGPGSEPVGYQYQEGVDFVVNLVAGTLTPVPGGAISTGTKLNVNFMEGQVPIASPNTVPAVTSLYVLDIAKIKPTDPDCLYAFADGDTGWNKANLHISYNGGASYVFAAKFAARSTFGDCNTILGDYLGSPGDYDIINTISIIAPFHAELGSVSNADIDAGFNMFQIGNETIQARTIDLTSINSEGNKFYTLSNLKRGINNTLSTGHTTNEKFFYLSGYSLKLPLDSSDIGKTAYFKALTVGQVLSDVTTPFILTIIGRNITGNTTINYEQVRFYS